MSIYLVKPRFSKSKIALAMIAMGVVPMEGFAQSETVIEEVVVTGSNIRRSRDFDTPSPIVTVGQPTLVPTWRVTVRRRGLPSSASVVWV